MDVDQFWKLIEASRNGTATCEDQCVRLTDLLTAATPAEIRAFEHHLQLRLNEAYRWDLWAVAYLINGGSSDDGFEYFRGWLVLQGRDFYQAVLASPERTAERVTGDEEFVECEDVLYVASEAYERMTGREIPVDDVEILLTPVGTAWSEEELPALYPDLWARFAG